MPWEGIRLGNGHVGGYRLATFNRHGFRVLFAGALLLFWLIALMHRRIPWNVTLGAATMSCTILAAMFARTFATSATGHLVISLALLASVFAIGLVGRVGAAGEATADY
jgi:hypothetical protein